jgi:hypothetical protein
MNKNLLSILQTKIKWLPIDQKNLFKFQASVDGITMQLEINDFPEHPFIYSFTCEYATFDALELPSCWELPIEQNKQG